MYNRDRAGRIKPLDPYRCKKCKGRSRNEVHLVVLCKHCTRRVWDSRQLSRRMRSVRKKVS